MAYMDTYEFAADQVGLCDTIQGQPNKLGRLMAMTILLFQQILHSESLELDRTIHLHIDGQHDMYDV